MIMNNVRNITNFTENSKKGENDMNKVGTIYKNIANECLIAWYPDMSDAERNDLLGRGDLQEIESYIGAKSSIDTAIEAVRYGLEGHQIYLPNNFSDIIYYSDTPNGDIEEFTMKINKNPVIDEGIKAMIAVRALNKIHERWIEDNTKKFFDEKRRNKRYMFLPIEFIGWDEVLKDYVFLRPILQLLCIRPETHIIQMVYTAYAVKFDDDGYDWVVAEIKESLMLIKQDISDEEIKEVAEQVALRSPIF